MNLVERYQKRYGIKTRLRGYQLQALAKGLQGPAVAWLMAPRLGKTRIDIALSGYLFLQGEITRWVIIGPSIAKEVWAKEIADTLDVPYKLEIVEGKAAERQLLLKTWKDEPGKLSIVVMNFEATWRLKKFLYKFNPSRITVDESHRIKHRAAKQSRTIRTFGRRAEYRSILTGTLMSKPTDVYSQYDFLAPGLFPKRWADFCSEYVDKYGYGGYKPKTYKNLEQLNRKIQSVAFQLTREQAGGFPTEHAQVVHFELTNPARRHYDEMLKELKTTVDDSEVTAPIILVQTLRLQQITGGFLPVMDPDEGLTRNSPLGNDRIRALTDLMEEYPPDEPLVIFAKFRYELDAIAGAAKKLGRTSELIAGGIPQEVRNKSAARFQAGRFNTQIVQIRAGGIAIDLSRADTAIFYSMTHSFIDHEQAKARIIARTGGKKSLVYLSAKGTVDDDIISSGKEDEDLVKSILKKLQH